MKIFYIVYNDWTDEQVKILASFGIIVKAEYSRIDIEDGEVFEQVDQYLTKWKISKTYGTLYDNKDIEASDILVYISTWVNGFPQPEQISEYLKLTYDLTKYCSVCGIGAVQKEPFRLKAIPKWGNKKMFELNWVFDEIFVEKEFYESNIKVLGIECRPVLLYKNDSEIKNTVQLKLPKTSIPLNLSETPFEICKNCGLKKYSPKVKGLFPPFTSRIPSKLEMFKSSEYFGSEISASNRIFVTKKVYDMLHGFKIKPNVWPCGNIK